MSSIWQVLLFSLIGGIFSLVGGFLILANKHIARKTINYATPFAAGALLSAAFTDLLAEAAHEGDVEVALRFALVGILLFFILERFLRFFHHHHEHDKSDEQKSDPRKSLIIIGDTIHNAIDGVAIAAGFLVSPETGIVVTLAVAAHEIPQEIGDFSLLLKKGMSPKMVIAVNVLSALATTFSALLFFTLGDSTNISLDAVLGLVAGFFIYIAVSDIIPSIHKNEEKIIAGPQTLMLLAGVIVVTFTTTYLHRFIEVNHSHEDTSSLHEDHDDHSL